MTELTMNIVKNFIFMIFFIVCTIGSMMELLSDPSDITVLQVIVAGLSLWAVYGTVIENEALYYPEDYV